MDRTSIFGFLYVCFFELEFEYRNRDSNRIRSEFYVTIVPQRQLQISDAVRRKTEL